MRILIVGLTLFAVLTGCSKKEEEAPPIPVKTSTVTLQDVHETWHYSAALEPAVEVKLAFKQSGYVAALHQVKAIHGGTRDLQVGDRVPAGAVLARLQTGELSASVESANGQAKSAKGQLDEAGADLKQAKSDQKKTDLAFHRAEVLYPTKAMTRPDYDSAEADYKDGKAKTESSVSAIEAQQGSLQSAQAQVKKAKISLSEAYLTTPKSAVIVTKDVEVGSLVSMGTTGFTVADTRTVDVKFGVPDSIISQFTMGQAVPVTIDSIQRQFVGHVTEISQSADSDSRVFTIKVSLPNEDGFLKLGMIASVKIQEASGGRRLPVLPVTALISEQSGSNGYAVFVVVDEGGKQVAHLRSVRTGQTVDRSVVIEEGLYQGDRIIMERTNQLADGSVVHVVN